MWFSLSDQTAYFLWSLAMGIALGMLYDLLRMARMVFAAKERFVLVSDILFFGLCGVLTALFALPFNKGSVRGFIVFGEVGGFLCFRLTLGSIMGKIYAAFARFLRNINQKIAKILEKTFRFYLKTAHVIVYNVTVSIDSLMQKRRRSRMRAKQNRRRRHKECTDEQKNNKSKRKKDRKA